MTLFLTKCSVIFLCRRLFSVNMSRHIFLCDVATGVSALWCIASIITLLVQCDATQRIGVEGSQCPNTVCQTITEKEDPPLTQQQLLRWKAIGIVDAITEFFVVVLACFVVAPLKMRTNTKISALSSFLPRLVSASLALLQHSTNSTLRLIPLIALHVRALSRSIPSATSSASQATPTVYAEVQLIYAVFSAAIPAVNRWLRKFDTKMGGQWNTSSGAYGSSGRKYGKGPNSSSNRVHGQSYALDTMSSRATGNATGSAVVKRGGTPVVQQHGDVVAAAAAPDARFRPDRVNHTWQTQVPETDGSSGQSRQSQGSAHSEANIIRKDAQWNVHYDYRSNSENGHGQNDIR